MITILLNYNDVKIQPSSLDKIMSILGIELYILFIHQVICL